MRVLFEGRVPSLSSSSRCCPSLRSWSCARWGALRLLPASRSVNTLPANSRKQLSKLVFSLFLPCLIFNQLGKSVTVDKIIEWWFIPKNIVLAAVLGCFVGYVVALLIKPPPEFFNFTVVFIGIGSIGNIPLVILGAICREKGNPFEDPETCNTNGVAYISFGRWVGAVIVYTYVYSMLAPPVISKDPTSTDIVVAEEAHVADAHSKEASLLILDTPLESPQGTLEVVKAWHTEGRIRDIMQPPVVASLLALVSGCVPLLRSVIFTEHSFFYFLFDSLSILGPVLVAFALAMLTIMGLKFVFPASCDTEEGLNSGLQRKASLINPTLKLARRI